MSYIPGGLTLLLEERYLRVPSRTQFVSPGAICRIAATSEEAETGTHPVLHPSRCSHAH